MQTLQTPLCTLEPQVEAHAPEMYEVLCDPAIYQYEGVPPPSLERLAAGLRRRESRRSPDGTEQWLNWVVRRNSGELAGYVQATILPAGHAYVGYEFGSRHWRQGLGTAAVGAMIQELASTYDVPLVVAALKTINFRSMGLLLKLGFTPCPPGRLAEFDAEPDESVLLRHLR